MLPSAMVGNQLLPRCAGAASLSHLPCCPVPLSPPPPPPGRYALTPLPHRPACCLEDEAAELAPCAPSSPEAALDYLAQHCREVAIVTLGEKVAGTRGVGWGVRGGRIGWLAACPDPLPPPSGC
jgi:hypothetical protein